MKTFAEAARGKTIKRDTILEICRLLDVDPTRAQTIEINATEVTITYPQRTIGGDATPEYARMAVTP